MRSYLRFARVSPPAAVVAVLVLTLAGPARATANFPAAIQSDLALTGAPACALCHTTGNSGGFGTVNTPFGKSVRAHGLVAFDEAKLKSALDAMAADHTDSDADCVDDIGELKQGTDPNTATPAAGCDAGTASTFGASPEEPRYGCGAHVAAAPGGRASADVSGSVVVLVTALVGVALRRRRRARLTW